MKLPLIHFDHFLKHDTNGLYDLADRLLRHISLESLLNGHSSPGFEHTFRQLGATSHNSALSMVTWVRSGQHIYVVGPHVAEALRKTSLSGIKPDMVKPKQSVFYVALPNSPWELWGGTETKWHKITGVYVRYAYCYHPETMKPQLGLYFTLWGGPNEYSRNPLDDVCFWFSVTLDNCPADSDLETHYGESPVATSDDIFGLNAERASSEKGLLPYSDLETKLVLSREFASGTVEDLEKQRQTVRHVFRLVVNLILYVESAEPDIIVQDHEARRTQLWQKLDRAKKGKRKRYQRQLDNVPKTVIRYIGPKMEQTMREAAETSCTVARSLPRRHLVRPHWRHYWVGPKGEQRKVRKWIALFERGSAEVDRTVTIVRKDST